MTTRQFPFALLVLTVLLATASLRAQDAELEDLEEQAFKEAAALAEPSILRIQTVGGLDRVGEILAVEGPTTGVAVSKDGYVITSSFNFANKPSSIVVRHPDGRPLPAQVIATDHSKMLTLLKVEADDLTPAQAAPMNEVKVGQWALAMGRTFDESLPSVSVGIVSALNRIWGKAIQTDAKTSPVNYGGPLVDIQGRVMGILVPMSPQGQDEVAGVEWYDGGIGFAVPLEEVYRVLDRMKKGEELKPGLLGISFPGAGGVLGEDPTIDRVRVASPAHEAGLKTGDVLTEINGEPVRRQAEVKHALGKLYAGDTVKITVQRNGETVTKELALVAELKAYESGFLGLLPMRSGGGADAGPGVGVRFVFADSPAAKLGLKSRDRILKFNDVEVAQGSDLLNLVSRVRPGEKATLTWQRDGQEDTGEVELSAIPSAIPEELRTSPIPPGPKQPEGEGPQTGHFSDRIADGDMSYWAYVPDDYNPAYQYGLIVWIHPGDDTMEAALLKQWRAVCQQRGLILLAPRAENISRWNLNETAVVKDLVEQFLSDYSIDKQRVIVHTMADSAPFGYQLAFKYREPFRGYCGIGTPVRGKPPENDPDFRLQFHQVVGEQDPLLPRVKASVEALEQLKFPISLTVVDGLSDGKYPGEAVVETIARWVDMLDRI